MLRINKTARLKSLAVLLKINQTILFCIKPCYNADVIGISAVITEF